MGIASSFKIKSHLLKEKQEKGEKANILNLL